MRGGLDADAGHARHVVGGIAGQRLHLDHLFRRHAEFLDHLGDADAAVLHGVVHGDAVGHELHQILVGGDDGRGRAALAGLAHIGRDQIVGLEAALLEAGQVEGAHRFADQRELRDQIVRRRRPVRLVVGIELVAEGDLRLVEHDGEMGRPVVLRHVAQQLPQHVAEAEHGVDLQAVGFAVQRRQRVIGAENVGGTVDQKDMVALGGRFDGTGFACWCLAEAGFAGLRRCFRHGRNLGIFRARLTASGGRIFCRALRHGYPELSKSRVHGAERAKLLRRLQRGAGFFGAIQNASGRSNRKFARAASAAPPDRSAPTTPTMVTISETVPMSWISPVLQQQRPRRRHRQEEGEIDDDGMLAAIAQEVEPAASAPAACRSR